MGWFMVDTDYLLLDISNLLYRSYFANRDETDDITIGGMAMHGAFLTIRKYYNLYKPKKKIIMCFDRKNWRKEYTKSENCISGKIYKGHRRKDMTRSQREKYERFLEHVNEFEELIRQYTSIVCLAKEKLEADDLVAGFIKKYKNDKTTVISTDKDFLQLLRNPNVILIDPATGDKRTLSEWNNDVDYFLFTKMLRGDAGDNVQSSYPRVRQTRIEKAFHDPIERVNMMNESWTNHQGREIIVGDLFKENQILMDLNKQPNEIKDLINETVSYEMKNPGTYSHFYFVKFLGKYNMKRLSSQAESYAKMLSC